MYAYFKGVLAAKKADRIIVEAGGIGYNIFYPAGRIAYLPSVNSELTVYTYTSVREDAIWLYGFPTEDDLELFIQLIGVSGVGPKAAQSLLSELSATEIRMAIIGGDIKTLCKAQGVAKKTAERLIVDLKGKISAEEVLGAEASLTTPEDGAAAVISDGAAREALEALLALGYGAREAREAVGRASAEQDGADTELLLKNALRYL